MSRDSRFADLQVFCLAVELGNFTQAARKHGVTPQTVSRSITRLEAELGVRLFRRNTRRVSVTLAGQRYYEACREALSILEGSERALRLGQDRVSGTVRVSVPTTYGHYRFLPMLAEFHEEYPEVCVEVQVSNRNVDFVREGYDLVVRGGDQIDTSLVARKLGDFSLGVFASPAYLERRGTPMCVEDLNEHTCVAFVMPKSGRPLPWRFALEDQSFTPKAAVWVRDDVLGLITCARAGVGLTQMYHYLVEDELVCGELVEVLCEAQGASRAFSLVYPRPVAKRPEVRALIDHVMEASRSDR